MKLNNLTHNWNESFSISIQIWSSRKQSVPLFKDEKKKSRQFYGKSLVQTCLWYFMFTLWRIKFNFGYLKWKRKLRRSHLQPSDWLLCFLWNTRHAFVGILAAYFWSQLSQNEKPANVLTHALGIPEAENYVAWFPPNQSLIANFARLKMCLWNPRGYRHEIVCVENKLVYAL